MTYIRVTVFDVSRIASQVLLQTRPAKNVTTMHKCLENIAMKPAHARKEYVSTTSKICFSANELLRYVTQEFPVQVCAESAILISMGKIAKESVNANGHLEDVLMAFMVMAHVALASSIRAIMVYFATKPVHV